MLLGPTSLALGKPALCRLECLAVNNRKLDSLDDVPLL